MPYFRVSVIAGTAAFLIFSFVPRAGLAQATAGVFGPVVTEGHRSFEYRLAYDPDSYAFAQRLHYQQSVDDRFMWRVIVQGRKTDDSDVDYDFVQGELFWDLSNSDRPWQTGFRFDVRVPDEGRATLLGAHWTNQFALAENWSARFVLLSAFEVGGDARDGILLQSRASLRRTFAGRLHIGLEMFSVYGGTSDIASFDDDEHVMGPFISFPLSGGWSVYGGALFLVGDSEDESNLRFWVGRSF